MAAGEPEYTRRTEATVFIIPGVYGDFILEREIRYKYNKSINSKSTIIKTTQFGLGSRGVVKEKDVFEKRENNGFLVAAVSFAAFGAPP